MDAVLKHFWLAFIFATFANATVWWVRGRPHREANPELTEGYRSLIRGFLLWANVPWVVMGIGISLGGVPSIIPYLAPRGQGLFVHAFYVSLVVVLLAGTYWIFRRNGAESLVRHPGLSNIPLTSPTAVRALWLIAVVGGLVFYTLLYLSAFPVPSVRAAA